MNDNNTNSVELQSRALVRLALFNERSKNFLKREDILRVCQCKRRVDEVVAGANETLATIGMKLVPVETASANSGRKRAVKRASSTAPKYYCLTSILTQPEAKSLSERRDPKLCRHLALLAISLCIVKLSGGQVELDYICDTLSAIHNTNPQDLIMLFVKQRYLTLYSRPDSPDIIQWGPRASIEYDGTQLVSFVMGLFDLVDPNDPEDLLADDQEHLQQRLTSAFQL